MKLDLHHLTKRFGGFTAVDDVSFEVPAGAVTGVIGPNGAGKSTLFSIATGFQPPDSGRVLLDGRDITALPAHARAALGMARTFQVPREFAHLTVRENLMAAAPGQTGENLVGLFFKPGTVRREEAAVRVRADETIRFLRLDPVADTSAGKLSGGQKKLLELGRALMTEPKLILLDEPFAGVNPVLVEQLSDLIRDLVVKGIGFLIIEHDLAALSRLAGTLHVMDRGRVIGSGAPGTVLADPVVREAYLGGVS